MQLFAFILTDNDSMNVNQIREELKKFLPSYMIPHQFIELSELPLTPNGKVDKKILESFDVKLNKLSVNSQEFSNSEAKIIESIKAILPNITISVHHNFYDLGFDSISMLQLASKLSIQLKHNIDVVTLFTYPTIELLANYLDNIKNKNTTRINFTKKTQTENRASGKRIRFHDE